MFSMALDDNFTGFEYLADEDHPNFVKEVRGVSCRLA